MKSHELKIWPRYYEAVVSGKKTFEYRFNDRGFTDGDILHLREWDPLLSDYTGRDVYVAVTYLLQVPQKSQGFDISVMAIKLLPNERFFLRLMRWLHGYRK